MKHVKILTKASAIDDPQEVSVEGLSRHAFGIRHTGMLHLYDDTGRGFDIGAVYLTILGNMRNFPTILRKITFPFPMPVRFVFPPWITITPPLMCPVINDTRTAFCNRFCTTDWAATSSTGNGLSAFVIYNCILHDLTPFPAIGRFRSYSD